jgi:hypothetical protein
LCNFNKNIQRGPWDLKKSQVPAGKKICVVKRKYVMMKEKQKGY